MLRHRKKRIRCAAAKTGITGATIGDNSLLARSGRQLLPFCREENTNGGSIRAAVRFKENLALSTDKTVSGIVSSK